MSDITLGAVFGLGGASGSGQPSSESLQIAARMTKLATTVTGLPMLPGVGGDMMDKLQTVLSASIGAVLTNAWSKRAEIAKYADTSRYPDRVNHVGLVPHQVKWQTVPTIEIVVNDLPPKTIEFKLDVTVHLDGAELNIQKGRLMGMRTGTSWVEGQLSSGKVELVKRKSGEYVLPGEISFGDGILIASGEAGVS